METEYAHQEECHGTAFKGLLIMHTYTSRLYPYYGRQDFLYKVGANVLLGGGGHPSTPATTIANALPALKNPVFKLIEAAHMIAQRKQLRRPYRFKLVTIMMASLFDTRSLKPDKVWIKILHSVM